MNDELRERFEIPKEMRSMAEASVEQARKTFEKFLADAQATAGSLEERGATVRAGAKDVSAKAITFAEKNMQASLDYADAGRTGQRDKPDHGQGGHGSRQAQGLAPEAGGPALVLMPGMRHCTNFVCDAQN
jgi:hypothetical protein